MSRKGFYVLLVLLLLASACTVESIDAEYKARLDACERILNEELRVRCLNEIPTPPDLNRPE